MNGTRSGLEMVPIDSTLGLGKALPTPRCSFFIGFGDQPSIHNSSANSISILRLKNGWMSLMGVEALLCRAKHREGILAEAMPALIHPALSSTLQVERSGCV
jgi:hypothetical protein